MVTVNLCYYNPNNVKGKIEGDIFTSFLQGAQVGMDRSSRGNAFKIKVKAQSG